MLPQLTELQEDALAELLNIGIGMASASFSEMVDDEVQLSVPSVEFISRSKLTDNLDVNDDENISVVKQDFRGTFWGSALLMFPGTDSLSLVRALTGNKIPLEDLTDMEQDVLAEIGNIVLNSCIGSLANVLGDHVESEIPVCINGTGAQIINSDDDENSGMEYVMLIRVDFSVPQKNILGYVGFVLDIESLQQLQQALDDYINPGITKRTA